MLNNTHAKHVCDVSTRGKPSTHKCIMINLNKFKKNYTAWYTKSFFFIFYKLDTFPSTRMCALRDGPVSRRGDNHHTFSTIYKIYVIRKRHSARTPRAVVRSNVTTKKKPSPYNLILKEWQKIKIVNAYQFDHPGSSATDLVEYLVKSVN